MNNQNETPPHANSHTKKLSDSALSILLKPCHGYPNKQVSIRTSTPQPRRKITDEEDTGVQEEYKEPLRIIKNHFTPDKPKPDLHIDMTQLAKMTNTSPQFPVQEFEGLPKKEEGKHCLEDFELIKIVGEGAFAKVILVKHKVNEKLYAIKAIEKAMLRKERKENNVKREKQILSTVNHPNIVHLYNCFTDQRRLYFVLEYIPNGTLLDLLRREGNVFSYEVARFYAAELVNSLEYLHKQGIAHRDLKPGNILLDEKWHLKLIDFGSSKLFTEDEQISPDKKKESKIFEKRGTLVGSQDYVSPEVLLNHMAGPATDLWSLGCLIYQFFTGEPPFKANEKYSIFEIVIRGEYDFPKNFPKHAKSLILQLLKLESNKRLGSGSQGFKKLKSHPFFNNIEFDCLHILPPPLKLNQIIKSPIGTRKKKNFFKTSSNSTPSSPETQQTKEHKYSDPTTKMSLFSKMKSTKTENISPRGFPNLGPEVVIVKEGILRKKSRWFFTYKTRKLVLTDQGRLSYYAPNNEYKGDIILESGVRLEKTNKRQFEITTSARSHIFKDNEEDLVDEWMEVIKLALQSAIRKSKLVASE